MRQKEGKMREIKFRLLLRDKIVGYEKWYSGVYTEDRGWEAHPLWLTSLDSNSWSPTTIFHTHKNQFTGLLDKNGVEIYEGDILKNSFAENLIQRGYFLKAGIPPQVIFIINDIRNLPVWEGQEKASIEIIGNIYEHPNLLTEAK